MSIRRCIIFSMVSVMLLAPVAVFGAATLDLTPVVQTLSIGESGAITLSVDTGGDPINAAESSLNFPEELITITGIAKSGLFSYWAFDPIFSNAAGTISFAGGLPNPGYTGSNGEILVISFTADSEGSGQLCETSARVLKNDGLGTNVQSALLCAQFTIVPDASPQAPTVTSSTHPDQTVWYPLSEATIAWTTGVGTTGISYVLDQFPDTVPDEVAEDAVSSVTFSNLDDGIWYFHIRAQNENGWGEAAHFTLQVDTTNPTIDAELIGGAETKDMTPDILISADDATSPILRITVTIDGVTKTYTLDEVQPLTLDPLSHGEHAIIIRAFDSAGNVAEITLTVTIVPKTFLENIGDTINEILPGPIRDFFANTSKPIRDFVTNLQENEVVREFTNNIAEPISRAAAAIGVATAIATLPAGLLNALFAFSRFAYILLSPLFLRRRARSWGVVINGLTRRPIGGVVVRVFETEFNKQKESQITDALGRFGFLVDPGSYTLMAEKQGFTFPSTLIIKPVGKEEIYRGGVITVDDKKNPHITATIPIDPLVQHITPSALRWKRIRDAAVMFLDRINTPLLVLGLVVSVWVSVVTPGTTNTLILGLYALLIVLKIIRNRILIQSFGTVSDAETKKSLGLAVVRIFNAATRTMFTTRITNEQGKFSALVQPGNYYVLVTKPPYVPYHSDPMKLSKAETLAMDVELTKADKMLEPKEIATKEIPEKKEKRTGPMIPPTQEEIKKHQLTATQKHDTQKTQFDTVKHSTEHNDSDVSNEGGTENEEK